MVTLKQLIEQLFETQHLQTNRHFDVWICEKNELGQIDEENPIKCCHFDGYERTSASDVVDWFDFLVEDYKFDKSGCEYWLLVKLVGVSERNIDSDMIWVTTDSVEDLIGDLSDYEPFWNDYYKAMQLMGRKVVDPHNTHERLCDVLTWSIYNGDEGILLRYFVFKHMLKLHSDNLKIGLDEHHFETLKKAGLFEQ